MMKFWTVVKFVVTVSCCCATKIYLKQIQSDTFFGEYWEQEGNCGAPWMKFNVTSGKFWSISNSYKTPVLDHNCYLLSDYYTLPSTKINVVFINVVGGGSYCAYVEDKYGDMCDQNYTLMAYKGHEKGDMKNDRIAVSRYGNITNVPNIIKPVSSKSYTYNETYSVSVFDNSAMRLLLYARYYWGNLHGVSLYYYICPTSEDGLAKFPLVNAPSKHESPLKVSGHCAPNSVPKSKKIYLECWYNGTSTIHGECICDKGYEFNGKICSECKGNTFKPNVGNVEKCRSCGRNALMFQMRSCICKEGHYREIGKATQDEADCYRPPSAPTVLFIQNLTENSGIVEFEQLSSIEREDGSVGTIVVNCSGKTCSQTSMIRKVSSTQFNITGLMSFNQYFFKAHVANSVTKLTGHANYLEFNFTTKAKDGTGDGGKNVATAVSIGVAVAVAVAVVVVVVVVMVVVFLKCRHQKGSTSVQARPSDANGEEGVLMSTCRTVESLESPHKEGSSDDIHIYEYIDPKTITGSLVGENPLYEKSSNAQDNSSYEKPDNCNEKNVYDRLKTPSSYDTNMPTNSNKIKSNDR